MALKINQDICKVRVSNNLPCRNCIYISICSEENRDHMWNPPKEEPKEPEEQDAPTESDVILLTPAAVPKRRKWKESDYQYLNDLKLTCREAATLTGHHYSSVWKYRKRNRLKGEISE